MADNGRNERILHVLGLRIHRPMGWMVRPGNWKYSMTCPVCGREEKVPTDLLDLSR